MSVAEISAHERILEGLWSAAARGRLPHALLFEGPAGVGKYRAALRLAGGLLCARGPGPPCTACGPCRRVGAGSHPDLHVLDPLAQELETIPVHYVTPRTEHRDVKTVEEFLALRAAEGGWRAVVLRELDRANLAAQNALLKTLEEPGGDVLLVLESSRPDRLLDTVQSRCARIRFGLLELALTRAALERAGLAPEDAALLARWCGGAPGRGERLARQGALEMRGILARVLGGSLDPLEAASLLLEVEGDFKGRTEAAPARARARAAVELALDVVRDLLRAASGVPAAELAHGDLLDCVDGAAPPACVELGLAVDALLLSRQDVEANLAPQALLDRAMLALERLLAPARHSTRPSR